jgi:carbonic anhydrase
MENPDIALVLARQNADFRAAGDLIREYVAWLGIDLAFQNFEAEMADLPTMYAEPHGGLLLALVNGRYAGVAGIRKFKNGDCELKRMFVRAEYRNLGLGRRLLTEAIALARRLGYAAIKLDTADFMQAAIRLYQAHGFVEIPAYRFNPHDEARYFELKLHDPEPSDRP